MTKATPQEDVKPAPARRRRADAAIRKSADAIVAAARELFLAEGYDGVNLDRIAECARVSRQTVYNRFGSKEAVFRAVVERHWENLRSADLVSFSSQDPDARDPVRVLRRFADAIHRFVTESDQISFTRLVIAESRRLPWIAHDFYRLGKEPALAAFAAALGAMTEAGALACPDAELAAHQFLGLLQEFIIWPHVMAIGEASSRLPAPEIVITEAIATFMSRYGRAAPGAGS